MELAKTTAVALPGGLQLAVPAVIAGAGEAAARRFVEFFVARLGNRNTRLAYARAAGRFLAWCEERGLELHQVEPMVVAAYVEGLERHQGLSPVTIKQQLAAIRALFDYLVVGQVVRFNPAAPVRGPRHSVAVGKTPVLYAEEVRALFDAIPTHTVIGLRDRALLGVMMYGFARVGAVTRMRVKDYYVQGKRGWFLLREKGGKQLRVPAHHKAMEYLDAYLEAAVIAGDAKGPVFRAADRKGGELTAEPLTPGAALWVVKRAARRAGLPTEICNHTARATCITNFLEHGGDLETAQRLAGHADVRTTKLYDRRHQQAAQEDVELIRY